MDLVAGLFGSPSTPPSGQSPATAAPAVAALSKAASATAGLPKGVTEDFAQRAFIEQLESQRNIAKLVDGKVAKLDLGKVATKDDGTEVECRVTFKDKTSGPGVLGLSQVDGKWYFLFVRGTRPGETDGEADSVATNTVDGFVTHDGTSFDDATVDKSVVKTMFAEQAKNQGVVKGIADGTITSIAVGGVKKSVGTATLDLTLTAKDGKTSKGQLVVIQKEIDGTDRWFITSFKKV
jgi:hypothetical protein